MSECEHFTIVFKVKDKQVFREFIEPLTKTMFTENVEHGATVVGAGWDDPMSRADRLVELCEAEGIPIPDELR